MKVLIVENEPLLADHLKDLIKNAVPGTEFFPPTDSIKDTVTTLKKHSPDLIFMDIELMDGNAFSIFLETPVYAPVIFATGFNQYIMNAFDNNGVAYLLKPISQEKVNFAIRNFQSRKSLFISSAFQEILSHINAQKKNTYKNHFLVKHGQKLIPVRTSEINHFYSEKSLIYLVTRDKKKYVTTESLSELEQLLNPDEFFRLNRKYLVAKTSISSLDTHIRGQVSVYLNFMEEERIIVSRQQTPILKEWLLR